MQSVGSVPEQRLAELEVFVRSHQGTEVVYRWLLDDGLVYTIHEMDEYTHDLVVALPDGLYLVYDTT